MNNGCPETKIPEGSNINYRPNSNPRSMGDTVQYIIYFDFDKYDLTMTSFQILDEVREYIKRHDDFNISLVGHTDLEGDTDYNIRLSQNRVKTSKNYLISYGIPADRISINYLGKSQPAIPSFDKLLAWKNRRVEIYLIKSK
jgi:outer membrane protein OmpA-like peptidoglycan-associated protein